VALHDRCFQSERCSDTEDNEYTSNGSDGNGHMSQHGVGHRVPKGHAHDDSKYKARELVQVGGGSNKEQEGWVTGVTLCWVVVRENHARNQEVNQIMCEGRHAMPMGATLP
jgi:hypothetical protein